MTEREIVSSLLAPLDDPIIVDLGACQATEEEWLAVACKTDPLMIIVEPDRVNYAYLKERFYDHPRRRIWCAAIGDRIGSCDFYINTNNDRASGSIRRPTGHLTALPHVVFSGSTCVNTITLDSLFHMEKLPYIDLLWVDIQGAENHMIRHGQEALSHTRYLYMEAVDDVLYAGMATRKELLAMLPGWTLMGEYGDWRENVLLRNDSFTGR